MTSIFCLYSKKYMVLVALVAVSCAKINFSKTPGIVCQGSGASCISANGTDNFDYVIRMEKQPVDILFVIDNSDSMYSIQQQIGNKFSSLLSYVSSYDYHVGVVTTDISGSANPPGFINGDGQYQDGNLVSFANGERFLTKDSVDAQGLFVKNISRQETRQCQNWVAASCDPVRGCGDTVAYHANCPSEDTRGIFAACKAIAKDQGEFLRPGAPLRIVILSNADERSAGGIYSQWPLEANDQPQTLVDLVRQRFQGNKVLTVDSIVVIPGDNDCYNQQHFNQNIFGWFAPIYQSLSLLTGGTVSSICAPDFSQTLAGIGASIVESMKSINLYCSPSDGKVTVINDQNYSQIMSVSDSNSKILQLPNPLQSNHSLRIQYECKSLD